MGLVLSIWKRFRVALKTVNELKDESHDRQVHLYDPLTVEMRKTTTQEILEDIQKDINDLESNLHRNRELQRRTALNLILFSVGIFFSTAIVFYIWFLPDDVSGRIVWTLPFLCFPFIVTLLKRLLHFIFVTRINKQAKLLEELNKRKKKILEEVMDKETYKVAKELLTKYDPHGKLVQRDSEIRLSPVLKVPSPGQELIKRPNAALPGPPVTPVFTQSPAPPPGSERKRPPLVHQSQSVTLPPARESPRMGNGQSTPNLSRSNLLDTMSASTPNLTCPILPRDRSLFDKVAEYFIGDGPSFRYALICKQCSSHNGMALEDEFEYIAFRCCYCAMFNPARKKRPNAPSLDDLRLEESEGSSTPTPDSVIEASPSLKQTKRSSQDISSEEEEESENEGMSEDNEKNQDVHSDVQNSKTE